MNWCYRQEKFINTENQLLLSKISLTNKNFSIIDLRRKNLFSPRPNLSLWSSFPHYHHWRVGIVHHQKRTIVFTIVFGSVEFFFHCRSCYLRLLLRQHLLVRNVDLGIKSFSRSTKCECFNKVIDWIKCNFWQVFYQTSKEK